LLGEVGSWICHMLTCRCIQWPSPWRIVWMSTRNSQAPAAKQLAALPRPVTQKGFLVLIGGRRPIMVKRFWPPLSSLTGLLDPVAANPAMK
jgi:hypothetical protein